MSKTVANRIDNQPCYVLSSSPWKESSLKIEVFSRDYGKVPLLARSARKPQSVLRGVLMPFARLSVSWFGSGELRTLHTALWQGCHPRPQGKALLSGLYLNELLLKLTACDDAHPELFDLFEKTIQCLCTLQNSHSIQLRLFEWQLLQILGFAPQITQDTQGEAIQADQLYRIHSESLPQKCTQPLLAPDTVHVHGQSLIDLHNLDLSRQASRQELLNLNRMLLDFRISGGLSSRRLLTQIGQKKVPPEYPASKNDYAKLNS